MNIECILLMLQEYNSEMCKGRKAELFVLLKNS